VNLPLPQDASFLANEDVNLKLASAPNFITIKLCMTENVLSIEFGPIIQR
jgi:hypothetical protein